LLKFKLKEEEDCMNTHSIEFSGYLFATICLDDLFYVVGRPLEDLLLFATHIVQQEQAPIFYKKN